MGTLPAGAQEIAVQPDRSFILVGGGAFAVEVATYLVDMRRTGQGHEASASAPIVCDVVDPGSPRTADLERVVGGSVEVHQGFGTIADGNRKLAIICVGDARVRRDLFDRVIEQGLRLGQVVHPSAYVAPTAELGRGVVVCPLAFIGPYARLEDNAVVNVQAAIGHDAVLEHSSVVSPGAQVNGFARCGVATFVGAGAVLYPKVSLGAYGKLSAGSVLARSVGEGHLMHGNPAAGRQMVAPPSPAAS